MILVSDISDARGEGRGRKQYSRRAGGRAGSSLGPVSPADSESLPLLDLGNWAAAVNDQSLPHSSELKPARDPVVLSRPRAGCRPLSLALPTPPPHLQARWLPLSRGIPYLRERLGPLHMASGSACLRLWEMHSALHRLCLPGECAWLVRVDLLGKLIWFWFCELLDSSPPPRKELRT